MKVQVATIGGFNAAWMTGRRGHLGILCEDRNGERVLIPGTSVICAPGRHSRIADVEALQDAAPFVWRIIGDASKVSTITNAVYRGYHAALGI